MAKYAVEIHLNVRETFTQTFEVEADNPYEAKDRAMEKALTASDIYDIEGDWTAVGDKEDDLEVWSTKRL